MDQRELYNVRDLPQEEGPGGGWGVVPWGEGHRFFLRALGESDQMGTHILERGVRFLGS